MTGQPEGESLRDRTRRAVRDELLEAAQVLFAERGYEDVTIDHIAAAVGLSRRSFFRYFGSKDDLVLGKFERLGEQFAEALARRPVDEPPWRSLRRTFDATVAYVTDRDSGARARELQRIIRSSETLRAGYLERMERAQDAVVDVLRSRLAARGEPDDRLACAALVAAAFACLSVANAASERGEAEFGAALDGAMSAIARGASAIVWPAASE